MKRIIFLLNNFDSGICFLWHHRCVAVRSSAYPFASSAFISQSRPKIQTAFRVSVLIPFFFIAPFLLLQSCSVSKQIAKQADKILLRDSIISTGHTGISIYDPATNAYLYNYNADKYFVPASNAKLFTLYAGMKYLEDSLIAARVNADGNIFILPTGDPTFLNSEYKNQPLFDYLNALPQKSYLFIATNNWRALPLGKGWAWDDYTEAYMAERSMMPVYENLQRFKFINDTLRYEPYRLMDILISKDFATDDWKKFDGRLKTKMPEKFTIERLPGAEQYQFRKSEKKFEGIEIPFKTDNDIIQQLLNDTLKEKSINISRILSPISDMQFKSIHSQPTDSVLIPMMHRSDNFFAEQTLLMASNEHLGFMNDEAIIDSLLNKDLQDIPQRPTWVDGSGLSRYNLFTPQSFIYILNKMKHEFGLDRLKKILPTGGQGTLKDYYANDSTFIYAKTGTLGGTVAFSGFLMTRKNKLLIFSVLINNFQGKASIVRRAVELFLTGIRKKY